MLRAQLSVLSLSDCQRLVDIRCCPPSAPHLGFPTGASRFCQQAHPQHEQAHLYHEQAQR
eukprot:3192049-Rhodomonas_salina.3